MKVSKLAKLAWVFFALTLATTTVFAQARGFRNRVSVDPNAMSCVYQINGLSDQQISEITSLEEQHQNVMAKLRYERRSTPDLDVKDQIRKQMDVTVENHRNEVLALLNEEQQKEYLQIQSQGTLHKYQNPYGRGFYGRVAPGDSLRQGRGNYPGANSNYGRGAGRRAYNQGNYGRGNRGNRRAWRN